MSKRKRRKKGKNKLSSLPPGIYTTQILKTRTKLLLTGQVIVQAKVQLPDGSKCWL